jgi:fatty acid synthase
VKSGERSVLITLADEEMDFLSGHVIDGRNLFPAMGYLVSFTTLLLYEL